MLPKQAISNECTAMTIGDSTGPQIEHQDSMYCRFTFLLIRELNEYSIKEIDSATSNLIKATT
jgi:hypothetical protein